MRNRSSRTVQSYTEAAQLLADFLHGNDLAKAGRNDIEDFLLDQLARHSPATAAVRFRSLQQFYKWAVEEEIIDVSPMVGLRAPTVPEQPVPIVDDVALGKLVKACEGKGFPERRDTAIVRVFITPACGSAN